MYNIGETSQFIYCYWKFINARLMLRRGFFRFCAIQYASINISILRLVVQLISFASFEPFKRLWELFSPNRIHVYARTIKFEAFGCFPGISFRISHPFSQKCFRCLCAMGWRYGHVDFNFIELSFLYICWIVTQMMR